MRPYTNFGKPAYGEEEEHEACLRAGLMVLGSDFIGTVCPLCEGKGKREQMFTAGCGGGYFRSMGECEYCDGFGLLQNGNKPSDSVVVQVINAGKAYLGR